MDERERRLLEKRYKLPERPHLIVHPSRTAKSGKFFCNVMSLSILLDYRPEDTKEHSFEVSLFAELFNEMLMRDFGFNIYKAIYAQPEKPAAVETAIEKDANEKDKDPKKDQDQKKKGEGEKSGKKSDSEAAGGTDGEIKDELAAVEKPTTNSDKDKSNDSDKDKKKNKERDRKRKHEDDADDDTYSVKSSNDAKKKDKLKYVTSDPDLLLSFVYFDQTHCGYIFEKDIEELFYALGLNLSRAQIRKTTGKVISRDSLFYR